MNLKKDKSIFYVHNPKCWFRKNGVMLFIFLLGVIFLHLFLLAETFQGNSIDSAKASHFGDLLGGYIGSIFSLISIILLYITMKDQRSNFELEKFENNLFQMITHHEHTVSDIDMNGIYGKKAFVWMIREYRLIHSLIKRVVEENSSLVPSPVRLNLKKKKTFMAFSYIVFFFGIGTNSSRILRVYLKKDFSLPDQFIDILFVTLKNTKCQFEKKLNLPFTPFEGHQSRLGDYYRHLFQMVKYVDSRKIDIDKYEYIKNIRAQLSNHEQALLLINSFSSLGQDWWNGSNYIRFYKFVSNIPDSFFNSDTEIDISTLFPKGYFEYEKII